MDVRDRVSYVTGCMMYKVVNGTTPDYLNDLFKHVNNIHPLCTRQSKAGDLYIPKCNTNYGKSAFHYKGCVIWNVLSKTLRNANTFMSFKMNFKKEFEVVNFRIHFNVMFVFCSVNFYLTCNESILCKYPIICFINACFQYILYLYVYCKIDVWIILFSCFISVKS